MSNYMTVEEADEYFLANRLITDAWDNSDETRKTKALTIATRLIDGLEYDGVAVSEANQFPRGSDTTVPTPVKEACAECAYSLLDGVDIEFEFENLWTTQDAIASVRASYRRNDVPEHKLAGIPSYLAWRLLKPFLRTNQSPTIMRV